MRIRGNIFNLALIALALIGFSTPAMAYIDPGSGSVIMSAIIGFFVAVGMAVKTFWYKIKSFFTHKNTITSSSASDKNTHKKTQ